MIKRYGGTIENQDLGFSKFVEVRAFGIALGLPIALISGAYNELVGVICMTSVVLYFFCGFIGELHQKSGFFVISLVSGLSILFSVINDDTLYIATIISSIFHLFIGWNAYALSFRNEYLTKR